MYSFNTEVYAFVMSYTSMHYHHIRTDKIKKIGSESKFK